MAKIIVMCPPTFFDVQYELNTNRWMDTAIKPDRNLAARQWLELFTAFLRLGLKVHLIPPQPGLPDMTFAANAGLQIPGGKGAIISNYFHQERRPENIFVYDFFRNLFSPDSIWQLSSGRYFEGQGDAIWLDERRVVIGYGVRTNLAGIVEVKKILKRYDPKIQVIPIAMRSVEEVNEDEKIFYHLDTCLSYLPGVNTFLIYEGAFHQSALRALKRLGNLIGVTYDEASEFFCNGLVVEDKTIFVPWLSAYLRLILENLGYAACVFPMSEFIKSGGAVKCLVMEIDIGGCR